MMLFLVSQWTWSLIPWNPCVTLYMSLELSALYISIGSLPICELVLLPLLDCELAVGSAWAVFVPLWCLAPTWDTVNICWPEFYQWPCSVGRCSLTSNLAYISGTVSGFYFMIFKIDFACQYVPAAFYHPFSPGRLHVLVCWGQSLFMPFVPASLCIAPPFTLKGVPVWMTNYMFPVLLTLLLQLSFLRSA